MSVLVTGSLGYVGSGLKFDRIKVIGLDQKFGADLHGCISDFNVPADVETVIHLADRRLEDLNEANWEQNVELHTKFLNRLSKLANLQRIVFASSCSVYGHQEGELDEKSPVMATSFYARSKMAVEKVLQNSSLPFVICRFGTAYGASVPMRWDLLPNYLAKKIFDRSTVEIYDPHSIRPYTHVADMRRALLFAADKARLRTVLNFATENFSKLDLIENISAATGKKPSHIDFNMLKKESRHYSVSSGAAKDLGFVFQNSVKSEFSHWKEETWKELS